MIDTASYQARLLAMREELAERLARIKEHGAQGVPSDSQEQATARENDDVIRSLKVHIEEELGLIAGALNRIDQGRYGACARCAQDIEPGRLDALPYTPVCSHCA